MVLFTTKLFRKIFLSRYTSQYVEKIVKEVVKVRTDAAIEEITDDQRGFSGLFVERMGTYDGLSSCYLVPKTGSNIDYWVSEYPDNNIVKLLYIFDHSNHYFSQGVGYIRDMSYTDHHAIWHGDNCQVAGGPYGLVLPWEPNPRGSIVTVFNGVDNYAEVPDHADIRVGTTAFSYMICIYAKTYVGTEGWDIRLASKTDSTTEGYLSRIASDGKVRAQITKGGVDTLKSTTIVLPLNTFKFIFVTWNPAGSVLKIYFDKTEVTTASTSKVSYAIGDLDLGIGAKSDSIPGLLRGGLTGGVYAFGFFRKELTQTDINRLVDSYGLTMSDLTPSQIAVVNYCACTE